jgi:hypothetical protein
LLSFEKGIGEGDFESSVNLISLILLFVTMDASDFKVHRAADDIIVSETLLKSVDTDLGLTENNDFLLNFIPI